MGEYKFIDHTADIAVDIFAESIEELFKLASSTWQYSVVEQFLAEEFSEMELYFKANNYEDLLVDYLNELNFLLLTKKKIFTNIKNILIGEFENEVEATVIIHYEIFNPKLHTLINEIKAVTFHNLHIEKKSSITRTKLVFDI